MPSVFVAHQKQLPNNISSFLENPTAKNLDLFTQCTEQIAESEIVYQLITQKKSKTERFCKWLEVIVVFILLILLIAFALRLVWFGRCLFWKCVGSDMNE